MPTNQRRNPTKQTETNSLTNDEISDVVRKATLIARQTPQETPSDAFLTVAANEHPEKTVSFAYAPMTRGDVFDAYFDSDNAPVQAARPEYTTTTTTYNDLNAWDDSTGEPHRTQRNQSFIAKELLDKAKKATTQAYTSKETIGRSLIDDAQRR